MRKFGKSPMTFTFIMAMDTWKKSRFELRKFAWSHEDARRKSKPSFLFSALSAFFAIYSPKNSVVRPRKPRLTNPSSHTQTRGVISGDGFLTQTGSDIDPRK